MKISKLIALALPLAVLAGAANAQTAYDTLADGMDKLHSAAERVKASTAQAKEAAAAKKAAEKAVQSDAIGRMMKKKPGQR